MKDFRNVDQFGIRALSPKEFLEEENLSGFEEKRMEFGVAVATATDSWKVVKRAEELGFSHAWFYDTQLLCADVYAVMALAAHHTSRIKLGTGVAIPSNRLAPVAGAGFGERGLIGKWRDDAEGVGSGDIAGGEYVDFPRRIAAPPGNVTELKPGGVVG